MGFQSIIRAIYPSQCVACEEMTEVEGGLCPDCWQGTQFLNGLTCDSCGIPLIGESDEGQVHCDNCISSPPAWSKGRSAIAYAGVGRALVLRLKHADRLDTVPALGQWLANAVTDIVDQKTLVVPVPLHWSRLLSRRYNQAALLGEKVAQLHKLEHCPDALVRHRRTKPLEGHSRAARFEALGGTIRAHSARGHRLDGRRVLIVDDVMTSGATLAACSEAVLAAGAQSVCVATLARVVKSA